MSSKQTIKINNNSINGAYTKGGGASIGTPISIVNNSCTITPSVSHSLKGNVNSFGFGGNVSQSISSGTNVSVGVHKHKSNTTFSIGFSHKF